ncbi:MAG: peptidoglycan DL-endopeptidase CwlO [Streptomycetaceae bacterium]|jgi:cell wall-associated NlpC family hydrolase|nr:peptidoglycan DL-endopeptidase CwlO [Streptomycetaceae bacterium]
MPLQTDTETETEQPSYIRRRRHATQPDNPHWARRAGVTGGVIGTLALSGVSAASAADTTAPSPAETTAGIPVLDTATTAAQAAEAVDQSAVEIQLQAHQDAADAAALKTAKEQALRAAAAKAAAAKKAAAERKATTQAASRSSDRTTLSSSTSTSTASGSVASVINFLKSQVGKAYVYGATGPSAYDCSGLTQAAFRTIGVDLPRTAGGQSTIGTPVSVSNVQVGDLLFWGGVGSAYHVAVYVGNGQYLDAANPGKGVVIQQMSNYMPTSAVRVA